MFKVNELLKATKGRLVSKKKVAIIKGISIDSRTIKPNEAFIAIKGINFDGHNFINEAIKKGASCIICKHKTVPRLVSKRDAGLLKAAFIETQDTQMALGDIARLHRQRFSHPVICITGSNGKTTTKEMLAWILSKNFKVLKNEGTKNNQIGLPMTLLGLNNSYNLIVLEVGTNHFGEVEYLAKIARPNIGVITNIGPSHLEYLKDLEGVFQEKYTLIKNLRNPRIAILNSANTLLKKQIDKIDYRRIIFGFALKKRSDFFATDIKRNYKGLEFFVNKKYKFTLKTVGYYNIENALAAIAVARILGIGYRDIALRLATFNFPQARLNLIKINKIRFIDDTYNSNPLSLKHALDTMSCLEIRGRKIFVMGDMLELGDRQELFHRQAGRQVAKTCDVFIAVGKLSRIAAQAASESGFDTRNMFICDSTRQARKILFKQILPGPDDVVLVKGSRLVKMEEVFKI
jgi:UDP-N-acetylmuramoyl-tripeptide--D-alanyl-D-alanine ligase